MSWSVFSVSVYFVLVVTQVQFKNAFAENLSKIATKNDKNTEPSTTPAVDSRFFDLSNLFGNLFPNQQQFPQNNGQINFPSSGSGFQPGGRGPGMQQSPYQNYPPNQGYQQNPSQFPQQQGINGGQGFGNQQFPSSPNSPSLPQTSQGSFQNNPANIDYQPNPEQFPQQQGNIGGQDFGKQQQFPYSPNSPSFPQTSQGSGQNNPPNQVYPGQNPQTGSGNINAQQWPNQGQIPPDQIHFPNDQVSTQASNPNGPLYTQIQWPNQNQGNSPGQWNQGQTNSQMNPPNPSQWQNPTNPNLPPSQWNTASQNPNYLANNPQWQNQNQGGWQNPNQGGLQNPNQGGSIDFVPNQNGGNSMNPAQWQNPNQGNFVNQVPQQTPNQIGLPNAMQGGQPSNGQWQDTIQGGVPSQGSWQNPIQPGQFTNGQSGNPQGQFSYQNDNQGHEDYIQPDTMDPEIILNNRTQETSNRDGSSSSRSQSQCELNCPTTAEYNPVCGTNNVTYANPGRLTCAQNCGLGIKIQQRGRCPQDRPYPGGLKDEELIFE